MVRRALVTMLTLASLAMAGLWVRSHVYRDNVGYQFERDRYVELWSNRGIVYFETLKVRRNWLGFSFRSYSVAEEERKTERGGSFFYVPHHSYSDLFLFNRNVAFQYENNNWHLVFTLPYWFLLVLLAAYPVTTVTWRHLQCRRRRARGQCLACGYDLTGNASGTCPECGQEVGP